MASRNNDVQLADFVENEFLMEQVNYYFPHVEITSEMYVACSM